MLTAEDVSEALGSAVPQTAITGFLSVTVVVIHWSEADMNCTHENNSSLYDTCKILLF